MWQLLLPAAVAVELGILAGTWRTRTLLREAKESHHTSVRLGRDAARNAALEAIEDLYTTIREMRGPITSPSHAPDIFRRHVTRYSEAMAVIERLDRMYSQLKLTYRVLPILLGALAILLPIATVVVAVVEGFPSSALGWAPLVLGVLVVALCVGVGGFAVVLEQRLPVCAETYSIDGDQDE